MFMQTFIDMFTLIYISHVHTKLITNSLACTPYPTNVHSNFYLHVTQPVYANLCKFQSLT